MVGGNPFNNINDTAELDGNNQPIKERRGINPFNVISGNNRNNSVGYHVLGSSDTNNPYPDEEVTQFYAGQNREAVLSANQSGWQQTRNALVQGAAEVTLGTLEGISYLTDLEQMKDILMGNEQEYSNWFADIMKEGKQYVNEEVAPIYRSEAAQTGFAPTDGSWWADNFKNIASTLSLMVPAYGAVKGASMVGKALGATKAIKSTATLNRIGGVSQAVLSRYMENTMEASETFNASYQELLSQGVSDDEARKRAGEAASKAWNTNWVNLAFDVVQYDQLAKGLNSANRLSKEYRKSIGEKALGFLGNMAQEGIEEGTQFIISQEAQRSVHKDKSFFEAKGFGTRLGDYIDDPEFKASVLLGAFGGAVFAGVGAIHNSIQDRASKVQDLALATQAALDEQDITTAHKIKGGALLKQAYDYAKAGKINDLIEHYKGFASATDEELKAKNMTDEQIADKRKADAEIAEDLQYISEQYSKIHDDPNKSIITKAKELGIFYEQRINKRAEAEINTLLDNHIKEANKGTDPLYTELVVQEATRDAYKIFKEQYINEVKGKRGYETSLSSLDNKISAAEEKVNAAKEALKAAGKPTEAPEISGQKDIIKTVADKVNNDINQEELNRQASALKTKEGQEELEKETTDAVEKKILDSISAETPIDELENLLNSKFKTKAKNIIDKIAAEGDKKLRPSTVEQVKERYKNIPLLKKDLEIFKAMGADISGIRTAEDIANKYAKDNKFREIFDRYFNDRLNKAYKNKPNVPSEDNDINSSSEDILDSTFPVREFSNEYNSNKSIVASNPYVMYYNNNGQLTYKQADPKDFAGKTIKDFSHIQEGGPHILYDKAGYPIRSTWNTIVNRETGESVPLVTDATFEALNDPDTELIGNTITFSIALDSTYSPTEKSANEFTIIINTDINGTSQRIGTLRIVDPLETDTDSIKARKLREVIYEEWKASGQTAGIFRSSIDTVLISDRTQGHFNLFPEKTYQAPHTIINEGEPLFFGVVDTDANGEVIIHTKQGEVRFGISDFQKRIRSYSHLADIRGAVVQFLKTPNGDYAITKLFTSKLSQFTEEQAFVKNTLEKFDKEVQKLNTQEEIDALVETTSKKMLGTIYINFVYKDGQYMNVTRDRNKEVVLSDPFGLEEYLTFLNDKVVDVDLDQLNVGDYNKRISEKGFVSTNIKPGNHFIASQVKMRLPETFSVSKPSVAKTTTVEPVISDIDAKKAEIEKRSQEKENSFEEAGKKAKDKSDGKIIGQWILDNAKVGDTIIGEDGNGYEVTNIDKNGNVELTLFEINEKGEKEYVKTADGIRLISKNQLKQGDLFEYSYTDLNGNKVIKQYKYNSKYDAELKALEQPTSTTQPSTSVKPGAQELFESNPELASIGTQEQYSQYLDTIFPDSKVKDIVYHFSNVQINKLDKEKFSLSANINRRKGFFGISKNINPGNNFANVEGTIPHAMLFNMQNPDFGDFSIIPPVVAKDKTKDSAIIKQKGDINYYSVFEPEQIHILGSKQDIEGFKEFTNSKSTEQSIQPKIERPKGRRSSIPKVRRERVKSETSYEVWNEKEETAWFSKYYPNVDKPTIADLKKIGVAGGVDLWGLFKNGAIYIDLQAKTGTLYHEAFHLVFHVMLNENERTHLLSLADKDIKGKINREEYLADKYMEHKLTEGYATKGLAAEIKDFFKRLYNLIQIAAERVGLKDAPSLNNYFYRIDRGLYGKFKVPTFTKNITRFNLSKDQEMGYLNDREQQIAQRHINNMLFFDVLPEFRKELDIEGKDDQETIQYIIKKGRSEKYTDYSISGMYARVYDNLLEDLKEAKAIEDPKPYEIQAAEELQRLVNSFGEPDPITGQFELNSFLEKALTRLSEKGVNISILNKTVKKAANTEDNADVMEMSESEDALEGWQVKVEYSSPFESFSQRFLKTLSIVPSKDGSFGGFQVYEDPSRVKLALLNGIANSINEVDMMNNLDTMISKFPQYEVIKKEFQNNPSLLSEAWVNIGQRTHVPYVGLRNDRQGNTFTFESTRKTLDKDLIDNWQALFYDSNMYIKSTGEVKIPNVDKLLERLEAFKDSLTKADQLTRRSAASEEFIKELHSISNSIALPITLEEYTKMFGQNKKGFVDMHDFVIGKGESKSGLRNIILSMSKGNDPYDGTIVSNKDSLLTIAKKVVEVSPHMYQVSFIDGENKNRFSLLQSRFMTKFVNRIKHPDYRKNMLESYKRDPYFKNSPFLKDIEENATFNSKLRIGMFDVVNEDGRKSSLQYSQMTKAELEATKISMWFDKHSDAKSDPFYGWYFFPVLSDITTAPIIQSLKFDTDVAIEKLIKTANQEKDLIDWLNTQIEPVKEDFDKWLSKKGALPESLRKIPTQLLLNGREYQHFAFLNNESTLNDANFNGLAEKGIRNILKEEINALFTDKIVKRDTNNTVEDLTGLIHKDLLNKFDENIEKYVANSMYMNIQLMTTFAGPLAYYKGKGDVNMEDVFKRLKEIYSPSEMLSINPENSFGDFKVRETYNVSYVVDPSDNEKIRSEYGKQFNTIFPGENNKALRIHYGVEDDLNNPNDGGLNISDAATLIDIYRYKEIATGTTLWTDEHEKTYNTIMTGKNIPANAAIVMNPFKPFQFGHTSIPQGKDTSLITPYQHKNAEFILVPQMAKGNPTLKKILTKMGYTFAADGSFTFDTANRITDSVMFGTAVKVGQYNMVDSIDDISIENVHTFNNSDYGIQGKTPEHHLDAENLFATQMRKLIMGAVDINGKYIVDGKEVSGQYVFDTYQDLIHRNLVASEEDLKKEWYNEDGTPNKRKFVEFLREQVSEDQHGAEILTALDWKDGSETETVLPLWDASIATMVENIFTSFYKNNITKQKINGASLYNAPSYGFENENPKGLRKPKIVFNKSDRSIDHFEVLMPIHSRRLISKYMDANGMLDVKRLEKVDPKLLKGIFYRIPTEGIYSMFHIKVIGYIPTGAIVFPDEITSIAGLDFDIDKVFGMLYNLEEAQGDIVEEAYAAWEAYDASKIVNPKTEKTYIKNRIPNYDPERGRIDYANQNDLEWDPEYQVFRKATEIKAIPSGFDTKESRDNMLIDIMYAVLQHPETTKQQLSPGNFETIKKAKDTILDLQGNTDRHDLSPLRPSTMREIFERNMTGITLIGITANHTSNHALMIHGDFKFRQDISINGYSSRSLSNRSDRYGVLISKNLAEFSAAAVDNAKEPLASFLNMTAVTIDVIEVMLRTRHDIHTVFAFINNPVIRRFTEYEKADSGRDSKNNVRRRLFNELFTVLDDKNAFDGYNEFHKKGFENILTLNVITDKKGKVRYTGTLADSIKTEGKKLEDLSVEELYIQLEVLDLFYKTLPKAERLAIEMSKMRYDSIKNAAGPTISHTHKKVLDYKKGNEDILTGFDEFRDSGKIPFVDDFYRMGIEPVREVFYEFTQAPYATDDNIFSDIVKLFNSYTEDGLSPEEINDLYRMTMTVFATDFPTYSPENIERVVRTLPKKIQDYNKKNVEGAFSLFLKNFTTKAPIYKDGKIVSANKYPILNFNRLGVDKMHQDDMRSMWNNMINSNIEEEVSIAKDLDVYAFATTGLTFGYNAFKDLTPVRYMSELRENNIQYIDHLKKNFDQKHEEYIKTGIVEQIVRNNYKSMSSIEMIDTADNKNYKVYGKEGSRALVMPMETRRTIAMNPITGETYVYADYIKLKVKKDNRTEMILMKLTGLSYENETVTYSELQRLGIADKNFKMIEMSYAHIVNRKPYQSFHNDIIKESLIDIQKVQNTVNLEAALKNERLNTALSASKAPVVKKQEPVTDSGTPIREALKEAGLTVTDWNSWSNEKRINFKKCN
jgi:hypothetical protein